MSSDRPVSSPWGDPVRAHAPSRSPDAAYGQAPGSDSLPFSRVSRAVLPPAMLSGRERMRAAATLLLVAIVLGAAAAAFMGVLVWALAALFHHAASG